MARIQASTTSWTDCDMPFILLIRKYARKLFLKNPSVRQGLI